MWLSDCAVIPQGTWHASVIWNLLSIIFPMTFTPLLIVFPSNITGFFVLLKIFSLFLHIPLGFETGNFELSYFLFTLAPKHTSMCTCSYTFMYNVVSEGHFFKKDDHCFLSNVLDP